MGGATAAIRIETANEFKSLKWDGLAVFTIPLPDEDLQEIKLNLMLKVQSAADIPSKDLTHTGAPKGTFRFLNAG